MLMSTTVYAVIGGQNPGVRSIQPFTVSVKEHPTWPIIMKCSSEREALTACLAHGIIEGGIGFDASDQDTARFIFNSAMIRGLFQGVNETPFYPVYYAGNNGRIIYRTFDQVAGAVNGIERPIFRRVERFHEALVYMIVRGRHASLKHYAFEKSPSAGRFYTVTPQPATGSQPRSISNKVYECSQTQSSKLTLEPPSYIGPESEGGQSTSLAGIYQHRRNLRGIVQTIYTGSEAVRARENGLDKESPPSMGEHADRFFRAFGFESSSLWVIYEAYTNGRRSTFVSQLMHRGVAQLEAEWMWDNLFANYH